MDYQYELSLITSNRAIKPTYLSSIQRDTGALDFEPIAFTPEDLDAENFNGFITSRLETLVVLFTGEDPAKKLQAQGAECPHEALDDCDCPPVSIQIPTVLAYHAMTLLQSLGNLTCNFKEWETERGTSVRRFRRPTGEFIQTHRTKEGTSSHPDEWSEYDFLLQRDREDLLNRWYNQGIHLHHNRQ